MGLTVPRTNASDLQFIPFNLPSKFSFQSHKFGSRSDSQHFNPHFKEKKTIYKQQILPILNENIIISCHLPVVYAGIHPSVRRNWPVVLFIVRPRGG
jgi:hypothetical protein